MDHIVYTDFSEGEMDLLLSGKKTMIIRGAAGRKMPYGRVNYGDVLYLTANNGEATVRAISRVANVFCSEKLDADTSASLIESNQKYLQLTPKQTKRWAGKRYLVLISVEGTQPTEPFTFDKNAFGNMDDWLPVGDIESVKYRP